MAKYTAGQMSAMAQAVGFDKKTAVIMGAIGMAESGGDSKAHNAVAPDNSYGLWQINMLAHTRKELQISKNEDLFVPLLNVMAAKKIHKSQGLGAWSTYTSGAYKTYLSQATTDKALLEELTKNPVESSPIGEAVSDPLQSVGDIAGFIAKAGNWVSNPSNWVRIVYVLTGVALVVGGSVVMGRPLITNVAGSTVGGVVKGAMKGVK